MFFPYLNSSAERVIKEKSLIMAHSHFQSSSNPSSHLISYPIPHDAMMYHVAFLPFLYSCYSPLPLNIHPYLSCCLFSKHILNLQDTAQMLSPRCSFFSSNFPRSPVSYIKTYHCNGTWNCCCDWLIISLGHKLQTLPGQLPYLFHLVHGLNEFNTTFFSEVSFSFTTSLA